jgi:hypothetical protein
MESFTLVIALLSAPLLRRREQVSARPSLDARCKAVDPSYPPQTNVSIEHFVVYIGLRTDIARSGQTRSSAEKEGASLRVTSFGCQVQGGNSILFQTIIIIIIIIIIHV